MSGFGEGVGERGAAVVDTVAELLGAVQVAQCDVVDAVEDARGRDGRTAASVLSRCSLTAGDEADDSPQPLSADVAVTVAVREGLRWLEVFPANASPLSIFSLTDGNCLLGNPAYLTHSNVFPSSPLSGIVTHHRQRFTRRCNDITPRLGMNYLLVA